MISRMVPAAPVRGSSGPSFWVFTAVILVSAVVPGLISTGLSMEAAVKPAGATVS